MDLSLLSGRAELDANMPMFGSVFYEAIPSSWPITQHCSLAGPGPGDFSVPPPPPTPRKGWSGQNLGRSRGKKDSFIFQWKSSPTPFWASHPNKCN
jgi:hypothetical protein